MRNRAQHSSIHMIHPWTIEYAINDGNERLFAALLASIETPETPPLHEQPIPEEMPTPPPSKPPAQ